jgi:hypothetical protein
MKHSYTPILGALLIAILLIASAYFLKGKSIGDWVNAGIYIIGLYSFYSYFENSSRRCSTNHKR